MLNENTRTESVRFQNLMQSSIQDTTYRRKTKRHGYNYCRAPFTCYYRGVGQFCSLMHQLKYACECRYGRCWKEKYTKSSIWPNLIEKWLYTILLLLSQALLSPSTTVLSCRTIPYYRRSLFLPCSVCLFMSSKFYFYTALQNKIN